MSHGRLFELDAAFSLVPVAKSERRVPAESVTSAEPFARTSLLSPRATATVAVPVPVTLSIWAPNATPVISPVNFLAPES
jgi:hypothetical protein